MKTFRKYKHFPPNLQQHGRYLFTKHDRHHGLLRNRELHKGTEIHMQKDIGTHQDRKEEGTDHQDHRRQVEGLPHGRDQTLRRQEPRHKAPTQVTPLRTDRPEHKGQLHALLGDGRLRRLKQQK